jgi:hypothetical protein
MIIERFQRGEPERYLILHWRGDEPLHVVAADDHETGATFIASAYVPDPGRWDAEFKRRRR